MRAVAPVQVAEPTLGMDLEEEEELTHPMMEREPDIIEDPSPTLVIKGVFDDLDWRDKDSLLHFQELLRRSKKCSTLRWRMSFVMETKRDEVTEEETQGGADEEDQGRDEKVDELHLLTLETMIPPQRLAFENCPNSIHGSHIFYLRSLHSI